MGAATSDQTIHVTTVESMKKDIHIITNHFIRIHHKYFPDVLIELMINYAYKPLTKHPLNKISIKDNIFKIVMCGDPFVGKTCIVDASINGVNTNNDKDTLNITINSRLSHGNIDDNKIEETQQEEEFVIDSSEENKVDNNEMSVEQKIMTDNENNDDMIDWSDRMYQYPHKAHAHRNDKWIGVELYKSLRPIEKYECTVGCEVHEKEININDEKYELHIWDIGTNSIFTNIDLHFHNADGIFMVFDVTNNESFSNVKSVWKEFCDINAPCNAERILIGNKSDLKKKREVLSVVAKDYALLNGFVDYIEVSAKDMTNINYSFVTLTQAMINCLGKASKIDCEYPLR